MTLRCIPMGISACCSILLVLLIILKGRPIFDAIQIDNSAVCIPLSSATPLAMNLLAEFVVRKATAVANIGSSPDKAVRSMVMVTLILFDLPLMVVKIPSIQLAILGGQTVVLSSVLLPNGNSGQSISKFLFISTQVMNNSGWLLLFAAVACLKGVFRLALVVCGSACLAVVLCCQFVALIRRMGEWRESFGANISAIQRALWFDFSILLHTTVTWAICVTFCFAAISATQLVTSLTYVQMVPILAASLFTDMTDGDKPSLATTVFSGNRGFVRYVSHELRSHLSFLSFGLLQLRDEGWVVNPNEINSTAEIAVESGKSSQPKEQKANPSLLLGDLQETCDAAVQVLDEILVFDRLRDDVDGDSRTLVEVKPLLRKAIDNVETLLKSKSTSLSLDIDLRNDWSEDVSNVKMFLDHEDMLEVLKLVLGNAVRVSPPESTVQVNVSLITDVPKEESMASSLAVKNVTGMNVMFIGSMQMDVSDAGPGMSQDEIASLIRDVKTGLTHVVLGGIASGLGPSIAKALVERNGGGFAVSSRGLGTGCTFTVKVPVFVVTKNSVGIHSNDTKPNLDDSVVFKLLASDNSDGKDDVENQLSSRSAPRSQRVSVILSERRIGLPLDDSVAQSEIRDAFGASIMVTSRGVGSTSLLSAIAKASWAPTLSSSHRIALGSFFDFDNVSEDPRVKTAIARAYQRLQADRISFFVHDERTQKLLCIISQDIRGVMVNVHEGIVGACFRSRTVINVPCIQNDGRHMRRIDEESGYITRSALCSPILGSSGDAIGVVQALNKKNGHRFNKADENTIRALGRKMELLVQKCRNQPTFQSIIAPSSNSHSNSNSLPASRASSFSVKDRMVTVRTLRFLIVDDVAADRKVLMHFLGERLGHDVEEACDGADALVKVEKAAQDMVPFDAVFLDYVMPVMDGPATASAMVAMGFKGRIIGLTAFAHADAAVFMNAGVADVFEKPLSFALLMKVISEIEELAKKEISTKKQSSVSRLSIWNSDFGSRLCNVGSTILTRSQAMVDADNFIAAAAAAATAAVTSSIVCRFLVVDDSSTQRSVLRHMLEKQLTASHHVDEAVGGVDAIRKLELSMATPGALYDGIFLDYQMPAMDGAEVARRMRDLGYRNEIVIITECNDPDVDALMACAVTLIIEKPLKIGQIRNIVQDIALQGRHSHSAHSMLMAEAKSRQEEEIRDEITGTGGSGGGIVAAGGGSGQGSAAGSKEPLTFSPEIKTKGNDPTSSTPKHHCLVADDVLSNRKMIARILENLGHTVVMAEDGITALMAHDEAVSGSRPFDFVFMDYVMPNMDGPATASALRRRGFERPIIGVTGNVLEADVNFFIEHGANAVLGKPVKAAEVAAAMRRGKSK